MDRDAETQDRHEGMTAEGGRLGDVAEGLASQIVRAEANFLRLPLFTLDSKNMRTLDGLRCEGTFRRGDKAYDFSYVVTRNAATYYPGPLARSAHFALLSIATDIGTPVSNPITFTWRDLCGRMGIQVSGKAVNALREALIATKGLMIESRTALFSKARNEPITTDDRERYVNLYDQVEFYGATRPDGSSVDINGVWFSSWYLDNLNALYSGPLDYVLWRGLNEKSPIASRLYEFLFFKFFGAREILRFNYPTLVKFIPARTERYLSDAKKQLQPAFSLLIDAGLLSGVQWISSKGGLPQILLHRGPVLSAIPESPEAYDVGEEDFTLNRIEDVHAPEVKLVTAFHESWGNKDFRPSKPELDLARQLIAEHGADAVQDLLPRLVKRLKIKWSDAKTFCAITRYLPEVLQDLEREKKRAGREQHEEAAREESRERSVKQAQDKAVLKALWEGLTGEERESIRQSVLATQPENIKKFPVIIERFCLEEVRRQHGM